MNRTAKILAEVFEPRTKLNTWQWCEENIYLSKRITKHPGPYRTELYPWTRGPQEWFDDPSVRTIVLCWGARTSKTETCLNMIRKTIAVDHDSVIMAQPTLLLARSFAETRYLTSIEDCPALKKEKPENSDLYKLLEQHFKHSTVWLVGANSPAMLKGRGVTVIHASEVDTWPQASKKETGALQQLLERNSERWNRKSIIESTPTVESGQIWYEFNLGDQRYFFVKCPRCQFSQVLKQSGIRWPDEAKQPDGTWDLKMVWANTWYECSECKGKIAELEQAALVKTGEWKPTAPGKEPGRVSCHLSRLYSTPWHECAVNFLQSKNTPEELQRYVNSWLAEPFFAIGENEEMGEALKKVHLDKPHQTVPEDYMPIGTLDIQANRCYARVRCWNKAGDSIGLEHAMLGDTEDADKMFVKWGCAFILVDCNYLPESVFDMVQLKNAAAERVKWIACSGNAMTYDSLKPSVQERRNGSRLTVIRFRPNDWKEALYNRILRVKTDLPKWMNETDLSIDYVKHMKAERRREKRGARGAIQVEWTNPTGRRNDYWDLEVMQIVGFEILRPFLFEAQSTQPRLIVSRSSL